MNFWLGNYMWSPVAKMAGYLGYTTKAGDQARLPITGYSIGDRGVPTRTTGPGAEAQSRRPGRRKAARMAARGY